MGDDGEPEQVTGELVRKPENRRRQDGTFAPGVSGCPGGRPKAERDVLELARQRGPEVIKRLFYIAMRGSIRDNATVRACELLLERGYGKAPLKLTDENGNNVGGVFVIAMPAPRVDDDEGGNDGE